MRLQTGLCPVSAALIGTWPPIAFEDGAVSYTGTRSNRASESFAFNRNAWNQALATGYAIADGIALKSPANAAQLEHARR
jgi:hypothetical protein